MDLASLDFAAYSTEFALTKAQNEAQVSLAKKAGDQQEAVVGKLLEGVEAAATGKGGKLRTVA